MRLDRAVCLVTGASSGIGAETARVLSSRGALVIAAGTDPERTEASARTCGGVALTADLREDGAAARLAAAAVTIHGRVDVLVNNAGIGWSGAFAEMPPAAIGELVSLDLVAMMLLTRELLPAMLERRRGQIANVGSIVGHLGGRDEAVYAACKAGVAGFTEALRQECAGGPVGVSLISPGAVQTAFFTNRRAPYARSWPAPITARRVAVAIADAIQRRRPQVVVPGWMDVAVRVRGALPEAYRPLVDRFG